MAVEWNDAQILARARQAAFRGVVKSVEMVLAEGARLMQSTPKTGRVYTRRGREHQASAPGEAPAVDTGRLLQSARPVYNEAELSGTANWSTEYAAPLEFGTEKMEARPYARPALDNKRDEIVETVNREVAEALR